MIEWLVGHKNKTKNDVEVGSHFARPASSDLAGPASIGLIAFTTPNGLAMPHHAMSHHVMPCHTMPHDAKPGGQPSTLTQCCP